MAAPVTPNSLLDPCGRFLPALLYHDLRDRLSGRRERARARWGAIQRPDAPGKLLWVAIRSASSPTFAGSSLLVTRAGVVLSAA